MYPSSTSSSSQGSLGPNGGATSSSAAGLIRYGSAPSSLLAAAVDSVINPVLGSHHLHMGSAPPNHHPRTSSSSGRLFFPSSEVSSQLASEPSCRASHGNDNINGGLRRAHGLRHDGTIGGGGVGVSSSNANAAAAAPLPLVRHSSSPADFLNQLAHAACTSNDDSGTLDFLALSLSLSLFCPFLLFSFFPMDFAFGDGECFLVVVKMAVLPVIY